MAVRPVISRVTPIDRLVAIVLGAFVVAGCAASAPNLTPSPPPSPAPTSAPTWAPDAPSVAPTASPAASPTEAAGRELTCDLIGGRGLRFSVEVPEGWVALGDDCGFVSATADPGIFVAALSGWVVDLVPADPCQNHEKLTPAGETVDELVQALLAQEQRDATTPVPVTLGGYEGMYLEWSVPTDIVVLDDEYHVEGCDDGNYLSWRGRTGGTRYQQVGGQIDQLWVLDVDGQTVVIDASYAPDAPQRLRDELAAIVQTLEFQTGP
jgi:hypothetical protein